MIIIFLFLFALGIVIAPYESIIFGYPTEVYYVQNTIEVLLFLIGYLVGRNI